VSTADAKSELADIARGVRRVLEREQAAGIGEFFAMSAVQARRVSPKSSAPPEVAEPRHEEPESAALPPLAIASESEVDLFGNRLPAAAVSSAARAPDPEPRVRVSDLAPAGIAGRAEILRVSLPVLQQIAEETRACRQCGLCESRANAVPGVGSAASGIVFVGEAPGAEEDRRGEPFVGRAGELLTKIIQAMDEAHLVPGVALSRESVYICNVLKCRPPENRNPLPHEIELCSPYLERQLAALQPRIICCLGKFAAELLVGAKGTIAGLRGKVYRYRGAKLIVTYHPAACLRNPAYKRPVWEDMQLLAREYQTD
jgi:uracil-DNA glycosylase family 4